jgi:hypothetical protein
MNKRYRRAPTRSARQTQPELQPGPGLPSRATRETAFEQLKQQLLVQLLNDHPEPVFKGPIRRAANDAAALAWTTPYPLLLFPALMEEKAATARFQALRQKHIRQRSRDLMLEVE